MKKTYITKICLDSIFRQWYETELSKLEITKEQIINVVVENGGIWLIYWAEIDND